MSQPDDHDQPIRMVGFDHGDDDAALARREHPSRGATARPGPVHLRPLSAEEQQRLRSSYRLDLTSYVPDTAYLETVDGETAARLAEDDLVRAVLDYPAAAKIVPGIGQRVFRPRSGRRCAGSGSTSSSSTTPTWRPSRSGPRPRRCERGRRRRRPAARRVRLRGQRRVGSIGPRRARRAGRGPGGRRGPGAEDGQRQRRRTIQSGTPGTHGVDRGLRAARDSTMAQIDTPRHQPLLRPG